MSCCVTNCECKITTIATTTPLVKSQAPVWKGQMVHPSKEDGVDGEIRETSSLEYSGRFQVLLFYPLDFTFVCPTELCAFSDRVKEFEALGADVIGISVDSQFSHLAWSKMKRSQGGLAPLRIPLLADITKEISRSYGVLFDNSIALRGLFIIDGSGQVRHSTINDLPIGRSVDEVLRVLQAIQFTDKHGEVCPANWIPGQKTMKPDPHASLAYFEEVSQ